MPRRIPDDQLTEEQRKRRDDRERFWAIHGDRLRAEARERYHRLRKENPEMVKESWQKARAKSREAYNAYHREYRKRPDSPQLKGEFSNRIRRSAKTVDRRIEKAILKTQEQIANRHKTHLTQREMAQNGQVPLTIKKAKEYIRSLKSDKSCMDCGNPFPFYILEFDHRNPHEKVRNLASIRLSDGFFTTEDIDKEIAKCDLICANCHRVRTHSRPHRTKFTPPPAG